jgi:3-phenylpropionate/cinnamic acid dioxygenase small subunit
MAAGEPVSAATLVSFVYHEARLLDEKRFDEWYELLTEDARYWMPLTRGQPNGETFTSLFYEDKLLLKVRIERLRHPNAFSQQQPSFCQHILQQPGVESFNAGENLYVLRTPFMYCETQLDRQLVLAGVTYHYLTLVDGTLRMRMKKIELVNCDAAFPSIQLLL